MRPCSLPPQPDLQEGEETSGLEGVYPQPGEGALPKEQGRDRTRGAAPAGVVILAHTGRLLGRG